LFVTFDLEFQNNSNQFLIFCKLAPCPYRHMGLVFIKINWILKSPYTICHRTKKANLEIKN
jgi:hypothetical protein